MSSIITQQSCHFLGHVQIAALISASNLTLLFTGISFFAITFKVDDGSIFKRILHYHVAIVQGSIEMLALFLLDCKLCCYTYFQ